MKKYLYIGLGVLVAGLLATIAILGVRHKKLLSTVERLKKTELAYELENSDLKGKAIQAEYTIAELNNSKDSLVQKLNQVRKELKIKDKKLESLSLITTVITKTDTIHTVDTIFTEKVHIDTTIQDKWYKLDLGLYYPNEVKVSPEFNSELYIIASYKKVPINPAKCKIGNWFRKKTKIVEIEVKEENPYINKKQQKFIKVVK